MVEEGGLQRHEQPAGPRCCSALALTRVACLRFFFSRLSFSSLPVLAAIFLSACTTTAEITPDGTLVRHYFGYVRVVVPQAAADQPVYTSTVSVLGAYAGNGFGVGYVRDRRVVVPLDCRLVVLVANQQQLDEAMRRLNTMGKTAGPCAAVDQGIVNTEKEKVE